MEGWGDLFWAHPELFRESIPLCLYGPGTLSDAFIVHQGAQVSGAAGITPFVIVPANDFHHSVLHDDGGKGIEDTAMGVAPEVGADQRLIYIFENAL